MSDYRSAIDSYVTANGGGAHIGARSAKSLALAFAVMALIGIAVPLAVRRFIRGQGIPADSALFIVVASVAVALVGVVLFAIGWSRAQRYAGCSHSKARQIARDLLSAGDYGEGFKRDTARDYARGEFERIQKAHRAFGYIWKIAYFCFIALMTFALAADLTFGGFTLTVWSSLVPAAVFVAFDAASCANQGRRSFYGLAAESL